ncbi:MAG: iron-containing alcohol dehydrogenase [Chloroflexota bacterium]
MKILRINMCELKIGYEELPAELIFIGGRGLIAKIMNSEVSPQTNPLGSQNRLIIAGGPLAGTMAPQLGRISIGGKSPLTLGIKEANAGGPAAQKLDKLGIRAIVLEGAAPEGKLYCLEISKDGVALVPADEYKGMKNYQLVEELYKKYDKNSAIISMGIGGERRYKAASVSLTDMFGDPSRSAGRGGLGAIMGSKGLKALIIDDTGTTSVDIANKLLFNETVKSWVAMLAKDINCGLYSEFGTPFGVASNSYQGTMPANNYHSGRPDGFQKVTGEVIKNKVWERGGRMHGCMPGCVIRCSIIYNNAQGNRLASAYEYEAVAMLGTNLGITDPDAIARFKFICDDLGIDLIEIGSSLSVAASVGKMKMGHVESAIKLLTEIEEGTEFGHVLGNGVVSTAKALNISRIPAFKGQAMPAHDPRAVKGVGVTYATSPMGADHTAGLTYRMPLQREGQIANSLRFQIQAATCDTFGYCINSIPGGQASIYVFLSDLLNARYGTNLTDDDVFEIGKQTLKDELKFNEGAEFSKIYERYPAFIRTEALYPTNSVFDVEDSEIDNLWKSLETFKQPTKIWEIRFPTLPSMLFGVGVVQGLGERARGLNIKKALLIADPVMQTLGRANQVQNILERSGVTSVAFSNVEPDPPIEEIMEAAQLYREQGCDGLIGLGGGSSMDTAKAIAVRVTHSGALTEYDVGVGGAAKMRGPLPPIICIPTTSGTGSETNQIAVVTDKQRNIKFILMSDLILPKLALIDPLLCRTMPPTVTAYTGLDALAHCLEAYVTRSTDYHPYYDALALYGTKLIGRSLRKAFSTSDDIDARTDMCMAASFGGIVIYKGLGLGHAIGHVLGAHYHIPHGKACAMGLLCFVRAGKRNYEKRFLSSRSPFSDLAWALDRSDDLEEALVKLYNDLEMTKKLRDCGIPEEDLEKIAFETAKDVANLAGNPVTLSQRQILELLKEFY